jgi:hypothetical protein
MTDMTAALQHTFAARAFVIYDVERSFDERVCRSEQDVRDFIRGADLSRSHFIVVEFDTEEGWCRYVTDLFTVEEAEPVDEYPTTFNRTRYMRQAGTFGR